MTHSWRVLCDKHLRVQAETGHRCAREAPEAATTSPSPDGLGLICRQRCGGFQLLSLCLCSWLAGCLAVWTVNYAHTHPGSEMKGPSRIVKGRLSGSHPSLCSTSDVRPKPGPPFPPSPAPRRKPSQPALLLSGPDPRSTALSSAASWKHGLEASKPPGRAGP